MDITGKKYSLCGEERLKSRRDFEEIFSRGKVVLSIDRKLKAVFLTEQVSPGKIKIAAAVPGKAGMAVWRNRVKRLIKESFRHNKEILLEKCQKKNIYLRIVISPYSLNQRNYDSIKKVDLESSLVDLLKLVKKII